MVCEKVLIRNIDQGAIMTLNKILKNTFLVVVACLALSACATKKVSTQMQGDVYTGTDTVEYLASGVADRVCLLYTSPSPRDVEESRMPSSA